MTLFLHTIRQKKNIRKPKKRVGRGTGSGMGTFSTRGVKGQKSRTGKGYNPHFEGGQTPYIRRIPKSKGFKNFRRIEFQTLRLDRLNSFNAGDVVDKKSLLEKGFIQKIFLPIKIVATGKLDKKLTIKVEKCSVRAREWIDESGSKLEIVHEKAVKPEKQKSQKKVRVNKKA